MMIIKNDGFDDIAQSYEIEYGVEKNDDGVGVKKDLTKAKWLTDKILVKVMPLLL